MQESVWEKEYRNPKLVTKDALPQPVVLEFIRFLKKKEKMSVENLTILDLGCGVGRNSNYLALEGNKVTGMEISASAIALAKERAKEEGISSVSYLKQSIGSHYPFADSSFDIALDVTSSNSLNEKERESYLKETARVLKPGGYLFVRALCKDGDQNAKELIKKSPGPEKDTYILPEVGLTERVFSREDFEAAYLPFFHCIKLEKSTHYTRFNNRSYKRNFWVAYMKKR